MARRRKHEEHDNHEAWAIPYGDLVTLLLAFFVVMYSMSSVNDGKYRVLSDSLTEAFHGTPHAPQPINLGTAPPLPPIEAVLPESQVQRMIAAGLPTRQLFVIPEDLSVKPGAGSTALPGGIATAPQASNAAKTASVPGVHSANAPPTAQAPPAPTPVDAASERELDRVAIDVGAALHTLIASNQVRVRRYRDWVAVDISTDILFASGVARLSPPAVEALRKLAAVLKPWPNAIRVEGHTDNRPIATSAFPSNWELSAARAATVVHLFMDQGVAPGRLAVVGFGEYRPVMPNTTAVGRNANRRVEVVILGRDAGPETGL
jgi:chemotaxis protein MotB